MGKKSRTKGNAFERLVCGLVRAADPDAVVRRGKQSHLADEPDVVVVEGRGLLPRLWIECHHGKTSPAIKLAQAVSDVDAYERGSGSELSRIPVVISRKTGERYLKATIHLDDLAIVCGFVPEDHVMKNGYTLGFELATVDAVRLLELARWHQAKGKEAA